MKALVTVLWPTLALALAPAAFAHGDHETFAAGVPGDGARPARTVDLTIREPDGRMSFGSETIRVAPGAEFRLDSARGNAAQKAMTERVPDMAHHDADASTLALGKTGTPVWRFTKPGTYEFACLIAGHYAAGRHGKVGVGQAAR